jgi:FAD/FMN-containing dehydrogenase
MTYPALVPSEPDRFHPLPAERLTFLEGWAMRARAMSYVYRPSTVEGIHAVLRLAQESGRSLVPRGSGFSYGDTALNAENIVLDLSRMNRVLDWDPATGVLCIEPGVTIGQLWRHVLEDGWWPAVVPGTMYPTLGGCSSTNVHGKNNWRVGSLGDQILSAELLLPSGETMRCSPDEASDIFFAAVGGLGLLGVFLRLTLRLERVRSGLLRVEERAVVSLAEMFSIFEQSLDRAEHLIGWIDAFAKGAALGRGLVQLANTVADDPEAVRTLRPEYQDLPDTVLGIVPRSMLWRGMRLGANDLGMRALNTARYTLGARHSGRVNLVPHAQFHFILDYVPNWKWAFRPGIIQYQAFVPEATAYAAFGALLEDSQRAGFVPYLAVFKRHRADPFLLSYSVDGYSLALDYRVTPATEDRIMSMLSAFTRDIVLPAGGRFYPAKDNALDRESLRQALTPRAMDAYLAIKHRLDPGGIFQSDLYRRVFS